MNKAIYKIYNVYHVNKKWAVAAEKAEDVLPYLGKIGLCIDHSPKNYNVVLSESDFCEIAEDHQGPQLIPPSFFPQD